MGEPDGCTLSDGESDGTEEESDPGEE